MLNCREITALNLEMPAGRSGLLTGLQVRLHLLICRHCRRFARQSRLLRKALARFCDPAALHQVDITIDKIYERLEDIDERKSG